MQPGGRTPPWVVDALLATAVTLTITLIVSVDAGASAPDFTSYAFALGFGALVLLRRSRPRTVLVATVLGEFVYYALDNPPVGVVVPSVVALFAAADAGLTRWAVGAGAVLYTVSMVFRIRGGEPATILLGYESFSNVALIAAAVAFGDGLHSRRDRERQQAEIGRLAARDVARREREAISRDLHDSVGHTVSVISLHAGVAADALARADDVAAAQAVRRIQEAGVRTLADLRSLVGAVRSGTSDGVLSLAGVEALTGPAREAGLTVEVDLSGVVAADLPAVVDAAATRIVQESLTNVVRHSGAGTVRVSARVRDDVLDLAVVDDGPLRDRPVVPGHGILGMSERVRLLDGEFSAGPADPGRGFAVRALIPVRGTP